MKNGIHKYFTNFWFRARWCVWSELASLFVSVNVAVGLTVRGGERLAPILPLIHLHLLKPYSIPEHFLRNILIIIYQKFFLSHKLFCNLTPFLGFLHFQWCLLLCLLDFEFWRVSELRGGGTLVGVVLPQKGQHVVLVNCQGHLVVDIVIIQHLAVSPHHVSVERCLFDQAKTVHFLYDILVNIFNRLLWLYPRITQLTYLLCGTFGLNTGCLT